MLAGRSRRHQLVSEHWFILIVCAGSASGWRGPGSSETGGCSWGRGYGVSGGEEVPEHAYPLFSFVTVHASSVQSHSLQGGPPFATRICLVPLFPSPSQESQLGSRML